jgi:NDP-sugar pyrophosphorylase family protein
MIILLPIGGKGSRFKEAGYEVSKPCILTTDRHSGEKLPMILCAMKDIFDINNPRNKIICVDLLLHSQNGTEDLIKKNYPQTIFIHDYIQLDQAYGCYLAKNYLNSDEDLFIGACDNGFECDLDDFQNAKSEFDVLMLSHSNDENIANNPFAHSYAKLQNNSKILTELSLKTPISLNPINDHATTGMFWFKKSSFFLKNLEKMIANQDNIDGKYYVDNVLNYCIKDNLKVGYFDVKYICFGTPFDYENYENTINYWRKFVIKNNAI